MNVYPKIIHHGAADGVTGSCHELRISENAGILIDCGLFQGGDAPEPVNQPPASNPQHQHAIPFPVGHLKALVVTHVHLDHVGRIPYLLAAGFSGPILCSEPSALLLPLMLEDALKVGVTRDRRLIEAALEVISGRIVPVPYGTWHAIGEGAEEEISVRLNPAGHILGSAWVQVKAGPSQVLFSGDLGAPWAPLLPAPRSPWGADVVVLESTYGDRLHEGRRQRRKRLQAVIERALSDRGTILVPAFALGRTQELLYEIEDILHRNQKRFAARGLPWEDLEIVLDSPLATRFTEAYRQLRPHWDAEAHGRLRAGCKIDENGHITLVKCQKKQAKPRFCVACDYIDIMEDGFWEYFKAIGTDGTFEMKPHWEKIHPSLSQNVKEQLIESVTLYLVEDQKTGKYSGALRKSSIDKGAIGAEFDKKMILKIKSRRKFLNAIFLSICFNKQITNKMNGFSKYNFSSPWNIQIGLYKQSLFGKRETDFSGGSDSSGWHIVRHKKYGEIPDHKERSKLWAEYKYNFNNKN